MTGGEGRERDEGVGDAAARGGAGPAPRAAIVLLLVEALAQRASWCGLVHVQLGVQHLQQEGVDLGFRFIGSPGGPASPELSAQLRELQERGLLIAGPPAYPYGPSYSTLDWRSRVGDAVDAALAVEELVNRAADRVEGIGDASTEGLAEVFLLDNPRLSDAELVTVLLRVRPELAEDEIRRAAAKVRGRAPTDRGRGTAAGDGGLPNGDGG